MDGAALLKLPWLLPIPADFSDRVKAARNAEDLLSLCQFSLDANQCEKLSKALLKIRALDTLPATFRLGILSNTSTDLLPAVLRVSAARLGVALTIHRADFDQVMQVALGAPAAGFDESPLDGILVALDEHFFPLGNLDSGQDVLSLCMARCRQVAQGLERRFSSPLIFQSIPDRGEPSLGSLDLRLAGTRRNTLHHLNRFIADELCQGANVLLDAAALAETVGLLNWFDPIQYFMAKLPFRQSVLPLYGAHAAKLIAAMRGKSRKCLVIDLDNTIWGGVIGDDGLEGIALGQGSVAGEAYQAVQRCILEYHQCGVVLAVSSKNNPDIALHAFERHEGMLLRREHIAVFQANWLDKASNINAIAKNLNLGLDALVFLDDNPVERQLVRDSLPQVAVPELPDDPAYFPRVLAAAGYFESIAFSDEDRQRNASYQANARRIEAFESLGTLEEYLSSLNMVLHLRRFDTSGLARIVQLINKTNQFNLTTRRHDQMAVTRMMEDSSYITLQARLADAFGDNGMIGVIIARIEGDTLMIDTFLMSCRVLERRVEHCLMNELVSIARQRGLRDINGTYIPTDRNSIVEGLYADLGFSLIERCSQSGAVLWRLAVDAYQDIKVPIAVER